MNSLDKYAEDNIISAGGDFDIEKDHKSYNMRSRIVDIQRGYTKDKKGIIMDSIQNIESMLKFEITEGDRIISISYDENIDVTSLIMVNTDHGFRDINGVNPVVSFGSRSIMKIEFFYSNWGLSASDATIYIDVDDVTQLSIVNEGRTLDMRYAKV
jgi:hypothetical protein